MGTRENDVSHSSEKDSEIASEISLLLFLVICGIIYLFVNGVLRCP